MFVVFVCLSVLFLNTFSVFASSYPLDHYYDGEDFGADYDYSDIAMFSSGTADIGKGDYNVRLNFGYGTLTDEEWERKMFFMSHTVNDSQMKGYENTLTFNKREEDDTNRLNYSFSDQFVIERVDKTKIASQGQSLTFSIKGLKEHLEAYSSTGPLRRSSYMDVSQIQALYMYVYPADGYGYKVLSLFGDDVQRYVSSDGMYVNFAGKLMTFLLIPTK